MKRRYYVKPVMAGSELFGWITLKLTLVESLVDDWQRSGPCIAIYNLLWMLKRMVGL